MYVVGSRLKGLCHVAKLVLLSKHGKLLSITMTHVLSKKVEWCPHLPYGLGLLCASTEHFLCSCGQLRSKNIQWKILEMIQTHSHFLV